MAAANSSVIDKLRKMKLDSPEDVVRFIKRCIDSRNSIYNDQSSNEEEREIKELLKNCRDRLKVLFCIHGRLTNECIMSCTNCQFKPVCLRCVNGDHTQHSFLSVTNAVRTSRLEFSTMLKKAKYNIQKINGLRNKIDKLLREKKRKKRKVRNLDKLAVLQALINQANESQQKVKRLNTELKNVHEILQYVCDTLMSWTYLMFIPHMQTRIEKLISRSRIGTFKCKDTNSTGRKCRICDRINHSLIIKGPVGCQEILGSFNCQSQNVVYVITCKNCGIQYVGETGETLEERMRQHMSQRRLAIDKHFKEGRCRNETYSVAVVFQIEDFDQRKQVETALMLKLGTLKKTLKVIEHLSVSKLFKGLNEGRSFKEINFRLVDQFFELDEDLYS